MQRVTTAALTVLMAFSLMLSLSTTASANALTGGGYSSSYSGESVFTNQPAGGSGQFSAIFFNDGTQSWAPGVVGLLVCAADKTTCNVASPNAAYASGWTSATVYATVSATVAPGSNGFFVYNFVVPAATAAGTTATFNGDVGLISTGTELRPQGYFQINTTPGATGGLTLSPTSAAVAVGATQQFTATGAPSGATVTWSVTGGCGAVTSAGLFAATAANSVTQPCSVIAAAGGLSATAAITVYGPATQIACKFSPTSIPADGGVSASTFSATLQDSNGNTTVSDARTISITNVTPTIVSISPSNPGTVNGVAKTSAISKAVSGTAQFSASATGLTGCSALLTVVALGSATSTSSFFLPATIAADGVSQSVLEVDITDANGNALLSGTAQITVTRDPSSALVCSITGSMNPQTATNGTALFTVFSTSVPGNCLYTTTTNDSTITGSSATLKTVIEGAPNKLVVLSNSSPKAADNLTSLRITLALQDVNGNRITNPTALAAFNTSGGVTETPDVSTCQNPITSLPITAGQGTAKSRLADNSGTDVSTALGTAFSHGVYVPGNTNPAAYTQNEGLLIIRYFSNVAITGCSISFTANTTTGVTGTSALITFTPLTAAGIACSFSPANIPGAGASAVSSATVRIIDINGNTVSPGSYSVSFSRQQGSSTTLLTSSPQTSSGGLTSFTVQATTTVGSDVYRASTTMNATTVTTGTQTAQALTDGVTVDCAMGVF